MPKLWTETVASHRQEVRDAVLDAAGELVMRHGLLEVTMSQLAEAAGIGRATLYKYFDDVEDVLTAWHQRHVAAHLEVLVAIAERPGGADERLRLVLGAYAGICQQRHSHAGGALSAVLHRTDEVARHEALLQELFGGLLNEAAADGKVRRDVAAAELADFCLHALTAAGSAASSAAVGRLVEVVWAGLTTPATAMG